MKHALPTVLQEVMVVWTHFDDMHSGGKCKEEPYERIYIEAPEKEACVIFYNRFHHSPNRVSCTCCGEDYSTDEYETLEQATGYHRGCAHKGGKYVEEPDKYAKKVIKLSTYCKQKNVLVIRSKDIKASERVGDIPRQGYVWCD
jgi:hypothetical protein